MVSEAIYILNKIKGKMKFLILLSVARVQQTLRAVRCKELSVTEDKGKKS